MEEDSCLDERCPEDDLPLQGQPCFCCSTESSFRIIVCQLVQAHSQEVHELRIENEALKRQLSAQCQCSGDVCSERQATEGIDLNSVVLDVRSLCVENTDTDGKGNEGKLNDRMFTPRTSRSGISEAPPRRKHESKTSFSEGSQSDGGDSILTPTWPKVTHDSFPGKKNPPVDQQRNGAEDPNVENNFRPSLLVLDRPPLMLRPCWTETSGATAFATKGATSLTKEIATMTSDEAVVTNPIGLHRLIAYPGSPRRLCWDLCGMILIGYDMITIPLGVFYDQTDPGSVTMAWISQVFWTCDMFASLMVGYVDCGETIMEPSRIFTNYLRTWFSLDCIVVIPGWASPPLEDHFADGGSTDLGGIARLLIIFRILRVLRLLRLAKLRRLMQSLYDYVESDSTHCIITIFNYLLLLLAMNHFIACLWFFIGSLPVFDGNTWVNSYIADVSWDLQYTTSLHWSLTQFTPGSMSVQPQNTLERTFALMVLMLAVMVFSALLGVITSMMTQLRNMREEAWKQFWLVRRFLKQRSIPATLAARIERYLEFAYNSQKQKVPQSQVRLLALLSEQLHEEMECEIVLPVVSIHPVFRHISATANLTMTKLSKRCMGSKALAQGDVLFFRNDVAKYMYFVLGGQLLYSKTNDEGVTSREQLPQHVMSSTWVSEAALWINWDHSGELRAMTECDVIRVCPIAFGDIICTNLELWTSVVQYASHWFDMFLMTPKPSDISSAMLSEGVANTCFAEAGDISMGRPRWSLSGRLSMRLSGNTC